MGNWKRLETECGGGIALDYHTDPSKYGGGGTIRLKLENWFMMSNITQM